MGQFGSKGGLRKITPMKKQTKSGPEVKLKIKVKGASPEAVKNTVKKIVK